MTSLRSRSFKAQVPEQAIVAFTVRGAGLKARPTSESEGTTPQLELDSCTRRLLATVPA